MEMFCCPQTPGARSARLASPQLRRAAFAASAGFAGRSFFCLG
jgi:hypothetical protein